MQSVAFQFRVLQETSIDKQIIKTTESLETLNTERTSV